MKGVAKDFWKYSLTLLFGGFLFAAVIIAIGIYYPWAAAIIVAAILGGWWYAMKTAPIMPDEYDRHELKDDENETNQ